MRRRPARELSVGLTPLIDVVFLLLIFFMVSATFLRETQLAVELPKAQGSRPDAQVLLEVLVTRGGRYAINGRELSDSTEAGLRQGLLRAAGEGDRPPLMVTADAEARHQAVVTVMDVAGQLGFAKLAITTRAPEE